MVVVIRWMQRGMVVAARLEDGTLTISNVLLLIRSSEPQH